MITDAEYQALKRAVLLRETRTVEFEGRKVLSWEKKRQLWRNGAETSSH